MKLFALAVTSSHLHGITIASSYTHQDRNAGVQIVYDAIYQLVSIAEQSNAGKNFMQILCSLFECTASQFCTITEFVCKAGVYASDS